MGRNNNGPIGTENQVRGEAINTRVVKLNPVHPSPDGTSKKQTGTELAESNGKGFGMTGTGTMVGPKPMEEGDGKVKAVDQNEEASIDKYAAILRSKVIWIGNTSLTVRRFHC